MIVKILQPFQTTEFAYSVDQVVDIPENMAKAFIERGLAQELQPEKKAEPKKLSPKK